MKHTGDPTADLLLGILSTLERIGTAAQKRRLPEWRRLIVANADYSSQTGPIAVSFATGAEGESDDAEMHGVTVAMVRTMDRDALGRAYEQVVGYNPVVEEPDTPTEYVRELLIERIREGDE